jgi:hypothetical protein
MGALIYLLCALTALIAFVLLLRGWRATGAPMLLWSSLCFAGLTASNFLLVADKLFLPDVNLLTLRLVVSLGAMLCLLYGLIWGDDR